MSDRIAVMRAGRIEQIGTPAEIYRKPQNGFVAQFIGEVNLLPADVLHAPAGGNACGRVAIRPETFAVMPAHAAVPAQACSIEGRLLSVTQIGGMLRYRVKTQAGTLTAAGLAGSDAALQEGQAVTLTCRPADLVPIAD